MTVSPALIATWASPSSSPGRPSLPRPSASSPSPGSCSCAAGRPRRRPRPEPMGERNDHVAVAAALRRIATGPEGSKDLSREEARAAMEAILAGGVEPARAAAFFVALRMKRESDDENLGVLDAIRAATRSAIADVEELVDLADPY